MAGTGPWIAIAAGEAQVKCLSGLNLRSVLATAWNRLRAFTLPVPAEQLPTGTIWVEMPESTMKAAAIYARVSSFTCDACGLVLGRDLKAGRNLAIVVRAS